LSQFDRNHDGAALGASHHVPVDDQQSVYPYTVQGGATFPDRSEMLRRKNMIHTTYLYLAVAVVGCMAGAWFGAHSVAVLRFFSSLGIFGFLGILFALNMLPGLAISVAEKNPRMAIPALGGFGAFAGLILAPMVAMGLYYSQGSAAGGGNLVSTACIVTGAIFASVTAYVFMNKTEIRPVGAMGWGILGFFLVAIPLQIFFQSSILYLAISGIIGLIGVYQLALGTSQLATNPNFNSPAAGALILFAGVFNLFQVILSVLMSGRD